MTAKKLYDGFMGIWLGLMILLVCIFIADTIPVSQIPGILFAALILCCMALAVAYIQYRIKPPEKLKRKRVSRAIIDRLSEADEEPEYIQADPPQIKAHRK